VRALWTGLFVVLCGVLAAPASAQGVGVRAGISGSPDQFYAGLHYETGPLIERLHFRPNVEVGFGSDETLVALNVEFAYKIPLKRQPWTVYVGAGPALNFSHHKDEAHADGGFNILVGLEHRRGLFTELKVGAMDSPGVKFGIGYAFH
jgi:hypothetical protein